LSHEGAGKEGVIQKGRTITPCVSLETKIGKGGCDRWAVASWATLKSDKKAKKTGGDR